jgi:tetratricopeptide (TPR) repeat protein
MKHRWIALSVLGIAAIAGAVWYRHKVSHDREFLIKQALKDPRARKLDAEVGAKQAAVAANPGDLKARWDLADTYQRLRLLDLAAAELDEIVKLAPDDRHAAIAAADTRFALGDMDKALAKYEAITSRWPDFASGWQGMAATYYQQRDFRGATRAARRAVKLEPENMNHRYVMATAILQSVQESPTPQVYAPLLAAARLELEKLLKTWPVPGEIHFRLGGTFTLMRDFPSALKHFRAAAKEMPTRPDVTTNLIETLMATGSHEEALKVVDKAIDDGMKIPPLFDLQGRLYQKMTSETARSKAINSFEEAVKLQPDNPYYLERLGGELARANRLEEARKALERALLLNPERAFPYQQLSAVYTRLGDTKRASNAARMATRMVYNEQQLRRLEELGMAHPEDPTIHIELGDRYRQLKMAGAAKEKYLLVLQLDPNNKRANEGLKLLENPPAEVAQNP